MMTVLQLAGPKAQAQTLRIFDPRPQNEFKDRVEKLVQNEWAGCSSCKMVNLTTYDSQGKAIVPLNPEAAWGDLQTWSVENNPTVLLINWNTLRSQQSGAWMNYLEKVQKAGIVIIFAAGQPEAGQSSAPLQKTLAGALPEALIIGELGESDRLWGASFFGPEITTALRPMKDALGQGLAPVQFGARLTKNVKKRSDWTKYLRDKKAKSKKIWLELGDCF
jgi:hypothetical protein